MSNVFQQKNLSNLEIAEFCNQLNLMLCSGISPLEALTLMLEDAKNESECSLLQYMIRQIEETGSFYQAVHASKVFPCYAENMIILGEESGTLDQIMDALFRHYTQEADFADTIRNALIYPLIMLGMMAVVIFVLLTKVMPVFQQVFLQLGKEMSGFSAGLLLTGELLSHYSVVFLLLLGLLILGLVIGRNRLPFQKKLQENIAVCRFANGMSIALKSGMTPEQGLDLVSELIENEGLQKKVITCKSLLENGTELSQALKETHIFSGSCARIAYIAGKAGTLDAALEQISAEYEHKVTARLTSLVAIFEPTLVILFSLITGVILFSVMLPLLGVISGL